MIRKGILGIFVMVLMITFSCDDDDPQTEVNSEVVSDALVSDNWRVTHYQDHDENETSDFNGFILSFTTGGAVIATKDENDFPGIWSTSQSNNDVKLNLSFASSPLEELTEDWEVIERSDTQIKLRHVSSGDGHIDYLTLGRV
jgi:hypothetical protein